MYMYVMHVVCVDTWLRTHTQTHTGTVKLRYFAFFL